MWEAKGAFTVQAFGQRLSDVTWHEWHAQQLADAGFKWFAVMVHGCPSGRQPTVRLGPIPGAAQHPLPDLFRPYTSRGLAPVAWGDCGEDAGSAGLLAGNLMRNRTIFKGYIADIEADYKQPNDTGRTEVFARAFDAALGGTRSGLAKAVSTYGAAVYPWHLANPDGSPSNGGMDLRPFRDRGWHILPQAYWSQQNSWLTPDWAVRHWQECGWPTERIHPTFGIFRDSSLPLDSYLAFNLHGTQGWSIWLTDDGTMTTADWQKAKSV